MTIINGNNEERNSKYIRNKISDRVGKTYTYACIAMIIVIVIMITVYITSKGMALFVKDHVNFFDFIFGKEWKPDRTVENGGPLYGAFPFLFGSFCITILTIAVSTPLSVGAAIFMSEINPKHGRKFLQPIIELLIGIPSVVYGYIGLSIVVPFVRTYTSSVLGFSMLAGVIVLSIMVMPTITSVSYDAFNSLPDSYKQASYALGATRWHTIRSVLLPAALPNVLTGVVLGMARAFGEALAVQMVIGNIKRLPTSILDATTTLTSVITLEMSNTISGSAWNNGLWSMGLILLVMTFIFIFVIKLIGKRGIK